MLHMQEDTQQETLSTCPVVVGIKNQDIKELVSALYRMPQMQLVRRSKGLKTFPSSVFCMHTVLCHEDLLSMRQASGAKRLWRQSVEQVWQRIPELDIAMYSVPHLHQVRC